MKKLFFAWLLFWALVLVVTAVFGQTVKTVKIPPNKDTVLVTSTTTTTVTNTTVITTTVIPTTPGPDPNPGGELAISFTPETGYLNLPFTRVEQWHDQNYAPVPAGSPAPRLDDYWRFLWTQLEGPTQGSYSWVKFDAVLNDAISKRQRLSFGIFLHCPGGCDPFNGPVSYDGGSAGYPLYLHQRFQTESPRDWLNRGPSGNQSPTWVPPWNSQFLWDRAAALLNALAAHINAGSFNGVPYKSAVNYIDIRFLGSYGEWHHAGIVDNMSQYPAGMRPVVATYKRIFDIHGAAFPNNRLVMLLAALDAERLNNTMTPVEVTSYALNFKNLRGPAGIRSDQRGSLQWNDPGNYVNQYMQNNTKSWNGGPLFNTLTMTRWQSAPLVGEPENNQDNPQLQTLVAQCQMYHQNNIGNGNFTRSAGADANMNNAASVMGYRLAPTAGVLKYGTDSIILTLNWQNTGLTPCYETWETVIEVTNQSGTVVKTILSRFKPELFQPTQTPVSFRDGSGGLPVGTYNAKLTVKDPTGYRPPLPLFIKGRNPDGSYTLGSFTIAANIVNH